MTVRRLLAAAALVTLTGCGTAPVPTQPTSTPSAATLRAIRPGLPQVTLSDPTVAARAWQLETVVTGPGDVIIGVDDIALSTTTHRAIPGTLALAREAAAWGRTVIYLTTNRAASHLEVWLDRAGYPRGELWTPTTAPCGAGATDRAFRAACVNTAARHQDVILWLTRGPQLPTAADRTYAFPG